MTSVFYWNVYNKLTMLHMLSDFYFINSKDTEFRKVKFNSILMVGKKLFNGICRYYQACFLQ